jgi:hypothetical protein
MLSTLAQETGGDVTNGGAPIIITGLIGLSALAWKLLDFLRMLVNWKTSKSGVITQALAWIAACCAVFLFGESQFGDTVTIAGLNLETMDTPTKLLFGLALGSTASVLVDFKQAFDNSDSNSKPPLLK